MLKVFEGPMEVFGTVILPTLAILALVLVPFLDRGRLVRLRQRTAAFTAAGLALAAWTGLTVAAVVTTPGSAGGESLLGGTVETWQELSPEELAGIGYYRKENCS